ncbi:uncharacterized protein si:ch211-110p13.9 [Hemiscyllium ocellatum]|uniref:uncharacterized protein si:ch211-110p13.9 n=1 Tax=Hemiscyllium ocellatum TaxID=170820 RepID=UPI0029663FDF|nr:uncharacterized protein si:ch211-110p13.9 [Hemiscyllium ocellatum]
MATVERFPLRLPEWSVGLRKFRYVFLSPPNSVNVCQDFQAKTNLTPLFLGADVVAKTGIRTENHPRIHARFAKKGLATKLSFGAEFRFEGLKVPTVVNNLWFYSIQGLFQVAFEMYTKDQQLEVLVVLQDLWKARINDPNLNEKYDIKILQNYPKEGLLEKHTLEISDNRSYNALHSSIQGGNPEPDINVYRTAASPLDSTHNNIIVNQDDHNYCMQEERILLETEKPCVDNQLNVEALDYDSLSIRFRSVYQAFKVLPFQIQKEHEKTITQLLDFVELLISENISAQKLADMMLQLLTHLQDIIVKTETTATGANSIYCSHMLYSVSNWLGHQFYSANGLISKQVEEFKTTHIDRITDLPPAEDLVDKLFPEAMKVLLLSWMGLDDNSALWKRQSEYPIVLLILEFANHNLITGVAHVLYSSLICK